MMNKKTFKDVDVAGKRVFVRCDFNVPLDESNKITDDTRICAAIPTIKYLINQNAKVILCSHLGRPKGAFNAKFSLAPVAKRLTEYLGMEIKLAEDVVGDSAKQLTSSMKEGEVVLLENVRFHEEEEKNDETFSKQLASLADVYVNDAFGTAHRAHASTAGIARYLPAVAGFLMSKEISTMGAVLTNPERPFVVIMGGAKISDKIGVIAKFLEKANKIIIGGAMANTFIVARGGNVGMSRYEQDKVEIAKQIMEQAEQNNIKIILPIDTCAVKEFAPNAKFKNIDCYNVPENYQGMDIGKRTRKLFAKEIIGAKTIVWNGPMGVYEFKRFQKGTKVVAKAVAKCGATSIIGGGDSVAAINESGYADRITHISTGGGATLEFLEGKDLPGVAMLNDR